MIAKVRLGRSFAQTVRYLFEGRKSENEKQVDKQAEIVGLNGVRRGTIAQITSDFQRQQSVNPDVTVAVWHTALAFSEEDTARLTNEMMLQLSLFYMIGMGIDPKKTQWLLVRHGDRAHPHVHLLINRILADGGALDTRFCNSRSRAVAIDIARREKLTISVSKGKPQKLQKWQKQSPWNQAKSHIYKLLMKLPPETSCLSDLTKQLNEQGIEVITYPVNEASEAAIKGITFGYEQQWIKGSLVDGSLSWPNLQKKFDEQKAGLQPVLQETQEPVRPDRTIAQTDGKHQVGTQSKPADSENRPEKKQRKLKPKFNN